MTVVLYGLPIVLGLILFGSLIFLNARLRWRALQPGNDRRGWGLLYIGWLILIPVPISAAYFIYQGAPGIRYLRILPFFVVGVGLLVLAMKGGRAAGRDR
jgi:hypothetical protein